MHLRVHIGITLSYLSCGIDLLAGTGATVPKEE
jgi:hypothetical protein